MASDEDFQTADQLVEEKIGDLLGEDDHPDDTPTHEAGHALPKTHLNPKTSKICPLMSRPDDTQLCAEEGCALWHNPSGACAFLAQVAGFEVVSEAIEGNTTAVKGIGKNAIGRILGA